MYSNNFIATNLNKKKLFLDSKEKLITYALEVFKDLDANDFNYKTLDDNDIHYIDKLIHINNTSLKI